MAQIIAVDQSHCQRQGYTGTNVVARLSPVTRLGWPPIPLTVLFGHNYILLSPEEGQYLIIIAYLSFSARIVDYSSYSDGGGLCALNSVNALVRHCNDICRPHSFPRAPNSSGL